MIALGSAAEALPRLERIAAAYPLDEVAQARLIRAYGAAGRRGQAFDAFHEVRRRLAEELGVDPGPELVAAHAELLRGTDTHRPRPAALTPVPAQLPPGVPAFTGRVAPLAALDRLGRGSGGTAVVA